MPSIENIDKAVIQEAKQNRLTRLNKENSEKININSIADEDIVIRVTNWDHIPLLPPKIKKGGTEPSIDNINKFFEKIKIEEPEEIEDSEDLINLDDIIDLNSEDSSDTISILGTIPTKIITEKSLHIRLNFPPFFHYRLKNGIPYQVGKSHWKVDETWNKNFENGEFCKTHGKMTSELALMVMKLTEKYALRANWRNYSYRDEMEGQALLQLMQVALQFDESRGQNPFAFYTQIIKRTFTRIQNIEKKNQNLRDDLLLKHGMAPSFTRSSNDAIISDYD